MPVICCYHTFNVSLILKDFNDLKFSWMYHGEYQQNQAYLWSWLSVRCAHQYERVSLQWNYFWFRIIMKNNPLLGIQPVRSSNFQSPLLYRIHFFPQLYYNQHIFNQFNLQFLTEPHCSHSSLPCGNLQYACSQPFTYLPGHHLIKNQAQLFVVDKASPQFGRKNEMQRPKQSPAKSQKRGTVPGTYLNEWN